MRRLLITAVALTGVAPLASQIASPDRPVTDPRSLISPANPAARPIPLDDIGTSRTGRDAAWSADGKQLFVVTNLTGRFNIWRTDAAGSWPVQITQSDDAQRGLGVSPDGKWLYFQQDAGGDEYYDLYRVPTNGGAVERLTDTPDRSESDIVPAPDGSAFALVTKLKSQGQSNLAVMTPDGEVKELTAEPDSQFSWWPVAWIEGSRAIVANRGRVDDRVVEVYRVDARTGQATKLLSKDDTVYLATDATADGRLIAVTSNERTGQQQAGLYDTGSKSWRWLKPTPWEQSSGVFYAAGRALTVRANVDGRSTLSKLDVATLAEVPLSMAPGLNNLAAPRPVSPDGNQLLVSHSGADAPPDLYLYDLVKDDFRAVTQLAMASLSRDQLPKSQIVTYRSFDGTLISAVVTVPFNLERDGGNAAVVIPHGGPTGQAQDGYNRYATALASRGYFVIQPNFRGSTGYGETFQAANVKDLGGGDLKDTVAAKTFLVESGYVDPNRVGIYGASYGGFMTLMAIGRTPEEFAAAVQWYGIINWRTMYRDQDERLKAYQRILLGTPDEDPKVYDAASPLTYIRQAKAPLLTLQGENDIRVPRGQAAEVHEILKDKGNVVETVFYPGEGHGFTKRENQLDSLRRTVEWFDTYLKDPGVD